MLRKLKKGDKLTEMIVPFQQAEQPATVEVSFNYKIMFVI